MERVGELISEKVKTVPCMVDRICTGRQIEEFNINVEAEPTFEGSLVVLDPPSDRSLVPFAGQHVVSVANDVARSSLRAREFCSGARCAPTRWDNNTEQSSVLCGRRTPGHHSYARWCV